MLDCTTRHLKTKRLNTARFKLLQGGPFTDTPGVTEPVVARSSIWPCITRCTASE